MKKGAHPKLSIEALERLHLLLHQMQVNPGSDYRIRTLMKQLQLDRSKLCYCFKQLTGYSVHRYVIKNRMEAGKKLLEASNKPIKEIALICGYKSHDKFSHAFKKYFRNAPSAVRNK
ncbi:MAG TPA: AraC family transcriptional regulator [Chitinophagaceae bacterium]|nr:AraC family transcriptional regulator [Chitinophagaceae bacterium]